jgi:hypothetical protein
VTDEADLTAGNSARREYERRLALREGEKAAKKRRFIAALKGPSAEEKRRAERDRQWAVGARGEEMLARSLARHCPDIPMLADRRLPGTRSNIDFLAIAASGVYVIDAKRYRGKIEIRKPLFGKQSLWIAGRNRTKLVDGLTRQTVAVRAAMANIAPDLPVHGCFCFVVPEGLPLLRTLRINGYPLFYPRKLGRQLRKPGPLHPQQTTLILGELAAKFPSA